MIKTGLLSVTFRQLSREKIIELAKNAELEGIEWGGDIHVPPGDIALAEKTGALTREAGLAVAAYGSYYRVGVSEDDGSMLFTDVLDSALALQTDTIRVWAGSVGSEDADASYREKVVADSKRIADMAYDKGIALSYEYHSCTLTDTLESTQDLLREVDHRNVYCYWQPPVGMDGTSCMAGLTALAPVLSHIHVFQWDYVNETIIKKPLAEGFEQWSQYLRYAASLPGDRYAMLEFVKDDDINCFIEDAQTLKELQALCNNA